MAEASHDRESDLMSTGQGNMGLPNIDGRTLQRRGRRTLPRKRPTEEADGVFFFYLL